MKSNFVHYLYPSLVRGILSLFVVVPLTTYYLNPEDFGLIGLITAISNFVMPASTVGPTWVLSAFFYKIAEGEKGALLFNILFWGIVLRLSLIAALWFLGPFFLPLLIKSYSVFYLFIFHLYLLAEVANCLWETVSYTMILQKKGKIYALLDMSQFAAQLLVLYIGLVILKLQVLALPLAYLASMTAGFVFCLFYIYPALSFRFHKKWFQEIIHLGLPSIPLNIFEAISNSVERFFIERWVGLAQLGIYTHSLSYRNMFMMPLKAFSRAYSPEVLEAVTLKDEKKIASAKKIQVKWLGLLSLMGIYVVLFARDAIALLTHDKFTASSPLVALWFILMMTYSLGIPATQVILAYKKNKFILKTDVLIGILSWGLTALAVKYGGVLGASLAISTYYLVIQCVRQYFARRIAGHQFATYSFAIPFIILLFLILGQAEKAALVLRGLLALGLSVLVFRFYQLPASWQDLRKWVHV